MDKQRKIIQEEWKNEFGELEGMFIPNYRKKERFLSNPEYKLYLTLKEIYKNNRHIEIFVQVALNQIVEFNNERAKKYFSYFKLEERSIDFVIYNTGKNTSGIMYCIELNDKTHEEEEDRKERDRVIKQIFDSAKIKIKFIRVKDIETNIVNNTEYFDTNSVKELLELNK